MTHNRRGDVANRGFGAQHGILMDAITLTLFDSLVVIIIAAFSEVDCDRGGREHGLTSSFFV